MNDVTTRKDTRRMMKAIPASGWKIIVAMMFLGGVNVGNKDIKELTGMSFPTIRDHLATLADWHMVTQTHRTSGWHLTPNFRQLILAAPDIAGAIDQAASEKNFHSRLINNIDINDNKDESLKKLLINPSEKNLHSPDLDEAIHDILLGLGIADPKAAELAIMPHMAGAFEYVHQFGLQIKLGKMDVPLAIWRMARDLEAPDLPDQWPCPKCYHLTLDPQDQLARIASKKWGNYHFSLVHGFTCVHCGGESHE